MDQNNFKNWMALQQANTEAILSSYLPKADIEPQQLHAAMRYVALDGGKRVRPLLVLAAANLTSAPSTATAPILAALEFIHVYSLVHDDMPAMDNDDLRRGKPTCHKAYDEATALLVGDALQTLAFEIISQPIETIEAIHQLKIIQILAKAAGHAGMAGGQAIDLASVGLPLTHTELMHMHKLKTGALIEASVLLGAMAGGPLSSQQHQALLSFSSNIGLAFQVIDDILDVEADTATLGKTAGKDAEQDKPTYVSTLGLVPAKEFAQTLYQQALDALDIFADKATTLKALAHYIVARSF